MRRAQTDVNYQKSSFHVYAKIKTLIFLLLKCPDRYEIYIYCK